jgi:hypothetical protein
MLAAEVKGFAFPYSTRLVVAAWCPTLHLEVLGELQQLAGFCVAHSFDHLPQ